MPDRARDPEPKPVEGPERLVQTDNRPNDWDPAEEVPQDADWQPPEAGE